MADQNQNADLPEGTDTIIQGAANSGAIATDRTAADDNDVAVLTIEGTGGGAAAADPVIGAETAALASIDTGEDKGSGGGRGPLLGGAGASGGLRERLSSGREQLSGQAAGKARTLVTQGLERTSEALANVSRMVGDTASGIEERLGPEYGDYARRAAGAIENAANALADKDADELIDDTRTFVRNSPGVALAGAAVVGFVLARLVKTGLPASRSGEDD